MAQYVTAGRRGGGRRRMPVQGADPPEGFEVQSESSAGVHAPKAHMATVLAHMRASWQPMSSFVRVSSVDNGACVYV